LVASVVDVTSVMVAYTIGIAQANILLGIGYAIFDAIIVVWMRKPITRFVRRVAGLGPRDAIPADAYFGE
jgi:hypothetical protein